MLKLRRGEFLGTTDFYQATREATVSVTRYDPADQFSGQMHYHEHPNFYFILSGGSIERRTLTEHELGTGSLRFYRSGEYHQNMRRGNEAKSINLEINSDWLREQHRLETALEKAAQMPWAGCLVLKIYHELLTGDVASAASVQLLIGDLIQASDKIALNQRPGWIRRVHELLVDRWDEFISLEELAAECGVNPITISKHFHRYFHCTLGEFMRKLKIEHSFRMIRSDRLSLTDIAYRCGFADQSHFIRCFKQYTGFLPAQFRKA